MNEEHRLSEGEELPPQGIRPGTVQFESSLDDAIEAHRHWVRSMRSHAEGMMEVKDNTVISRCVYEAIAPKYDHHIVECLGELTEYLAEAFDEGYMCHPVKRTVIRVKFEVVTYPEIDTYYRNPPASNEQEGVERED